MFRFPSKKTINEYALNASVIDADVSSDEEERNPTGAILLDRRSVKEMVEDAKPPTTIAELDKSSLHTTCSDASINLDTYRATTATKDSDILEDGAELSFHASHMENSSYVLDESTDLGLTLRPDNYHGGVVSETMKDDSIVPQSTASLDDDIKHDMETLISVSQQLLQTSTPNPSETAETSKHVSILKQYKVVVILALVVGGLARCMNRCLEVYLALAQFFSSWVQPLDTSMIREDKIHLIVGDFTFRKEEIDSSGSNHSVGVWPVIVLGMMAKLALSTAKKSEAKLDTSDFPSDFDTNSTGESKQQRRSPIKPALSTTQKSGPKSQAMESDKVVSFPSAFETIKIAKSMHKSSPIKSQGENPPVVDINYDLSKYEKLTVMELRDLLRSRKCIYAGRKTQLIQRLVSVYRAELESMTVVQLRRKLKSKNMKQGGLKRELVQKLVEAGL